MIYLLSTQAVVDILSGEPSISQWLSKVPRTSVEVSVVSIGRVTKQIGALTNPGQRANLSRSLRRLQATLDLHSGVVPFDIDAARFWSQLMTANLTYVIPGSNNPVVPVPLDLAERMVVATALARGGAIVEAPQLYHSQISNLVVENP